MSNTPFSDWLLSFPDYIGFLILLVCAALFLSVAALVIGFIYGLCSFIFERKKRYVYLDLSEWKVTDSVRMYKPRKYNIVTKMWDPAQEWDEPCQWTRRVRPTKEN